MGEKRETARDRELGKKNPGNHLTSGIQISVNITDNFQTVIARPRCLERNFKFSSNLNFHLETSRESFSYQNRPFPS